MSYKYKKYYPTNGIYNVTCDAAGGRETIWKLPDEVMNLAKSRLEFNMRIPPNEVDDETYTYTFKDVISPIRHIQLYTDSGTILCDIPYFNNYSKIVRKPFTPLDEYLTYSLFNGSYINGEYTGGSGNFLRRNDCERNQESAPGFTINGGVVSRVSPSVIGLRDSGYRCEMNYLEPQYFESMLGQIQVDPLPPYDPVMVDFGLNVSIQLDTIKNCIFGLNKDLYFNNQTVFLKIIWESRNRIAYNAESATDPAVAVTALTVDVNINNVTLVLACQNDEKTKKDVVNTILSTGLTYFVDYISVLRSNILTQGKTLTIKYTRGNGRKIKYIMVSIFDDNESDYLSYDCSNILTTLDVIISDLYRRRIRGLNTYLNDIRLQDNNISTSNFDDYLYLKNDLKKSVIQSHGVYAYNWFWLENFCDIPPTENNNDVDKGISLDIGQKYVFDGDIVRDDSIYYVWTITSKQLTINKYGITCV